MYITIFFLHYCTSPIHTLMCTFKVDKSKLKQGSRVALDMTTLTIMRQLPREVDPLVYNMTAEDPGDVSYSSVGGLSEQIRELREVGGTNIYFYFLFHFISLTFILPMSSFFFPLPPFLLPSFLPLFLCFRLLSFH